MNTDASPTPDPVTPPQARLKFSQELHALAHQFSEKPAQLSEILMATRGRGFDLVLVLLALPFLTPLPMVGLSTPLGFVVFLIGARLAMGQRPWLPRRLLECEIPPRFLSTVLNAASRVVRWLELLLRPRLVFLHEQMVFRRVAGAIIMCSGLLLLLPVPIPFTNTFPALTIVLIAAGAMERDGVFFVAGCAVFVLSIAYFAALLFGGAELADEVWHVLKNYLFHGSGPAP
jgi:hypothetical protein